MALTGLSGLSVGKGKLMVQRVPAMMAATLLKPVKVKPPPVEDDVDSKEPSPVVRLCNMIGPEDLEDEAEYADIKTDVMEECSQYGTVKSVEIPRPEEGKEVMGVGEIFVEFADVEGATKGRDALAGRKFSGKAVKAAFYPQDLYQRGIFGKPAVEKESAPAPASGDAAPAAEVQPGAEQSGVQGFVIVGDAMDGATVDMEGAANEDDDMGLPPDFDAEPLENFESAMKPATVAASSEDAVTAAAVADDDMD